jgi:hypothetical protein
MVLVCLAGLEERRSRDASFIRIIRALIFPRNLTVTVRSPSVDAFDCWPRRTAFIFSRWIHHPRDIRNH